MADTKLKCVEIWHIKTPANTDLAQTLSTQLSDDEKIRANKLIKQSQRHTFISSHAAMRRILADKLDMSPDDIHYQLQEHGKPFIDNNMGLSFNLSHSHDYAILAVSAHCKLGVDIEKIQPHRDLIAISERFFSKDEFEWLKSLPEDLLFTEFYQLWCHKEAFLKATGQGIQAGLQHISLSQADLTHVKNVIDQNQQDWYLHRLNIEGNFRAALAVNCANVKIHSLDWQFS